MGKTSGLVPAIAGCQPGPDHGGRRSPVFRQPAPVIDPERGIRDLPQLFRKSLLQNAGKADAGLLEFFRDPARLPSLSPALQQELLHLSASAGIGKGLSAEKGDLALRRCVQSPGGRHEFRRIC